LFKILRLYAPNNLTGHYRLIKSTLLKQYHIKKWKSNGQKVPPPHIIKQETIKEYAKMFNAVILVETGTYLGDMVAALKNNFKLIYSIELSNELWRNASKRFRKFKHIKIIEGDSGQVLINIIPFLDQRTIFWLDGHYSGGTTARGNKICPIYAELGAILNSNQNKNVILIDDARLFNGIDDYPKYEELIQFIKNYNVKFDIEKMHDIIRIVLKSPNEI
jgi:hypothetical protein